MQLVLKSVSIAQGIMSNPGEKPGAKLRGQGEGRRGHIPPTPPTACAAVCG